MRDDRLRQCPVHGIDLELGEVEVVYGLVTMSEEDRVVRRRSPLANTIVFGGCVERAETSTQVWFCRDCRSKTEPPRSDR